MPALVKVTNVSKSFGKKQALQYVSLEIRENEIFGLLGVNGAGKTTLMNIIMGQTRQDSGKIEFFQNGSQVSDKWQIKRLLGLVPQQNAFYFDISVEENIRFFGELNRIKAEALEQKTKSLMQWLQLVPFKDTVAEKLSGGYKKLLNIACTLIAEPTAIFFDEPTVGLDPKMRRLIWEKILQLYTEGKTICLTTHYIDEAEKLCDRVAIIKDGKKIEEDTPKKLVEIYGGPRKITIQLTSEVTQTLLETINSRLQGKFSGEENTLIGTLESAHSIEHLSELLNIIRNLGFHIVNGHFIEPTLENAYLDITKTEES